MTTPQDNPQNGPIVHWLDQDVTTRLGQLGLSSAPLVGAVTTGLGHVFDCTLNDAPCFGGFVMWDKTIRRLRESLIPLGWQRKNYKNYATTVSSDGSCILAVAAGNSDTGKADATPTTRTTKGPVTREAVRHNAQISFQSIMASFPVPQAKYLTGPTWLLLHYWDEEAEVVRIELSMPRSMTTRGFVSQWVERIILGEYHIDPPVQVSDIPDDDGEGDIEIDVKRVG